MDQIERFANVFDEWSKATPEDPSPADSACSCSSQNGEVNEFVMPTIVRGLESGTVPWIMEQR